MLPPSSASPIIATSASDPSANRISTCPRSRPLVRRRSHRIARYSTRTCAQLRNRIVPNGYTSGIGAYGYVISTRMYPFETCTPVSSAFVPSYGTQRPSVLVSVGSLWHCTATPPFARLVVHWLDVMALPLQFVSPPPISAVWFFAWFTTAVSSEVCV